MELFERIASKIVGLQCLVTQQKSDLSLKPHFSTGIFHLRGRLIHLTTLWLVSLHITTSHYQELLHQLHCIEQNIAGINTAQRQDQEKVEQDTENNTTQREPGTPHSWLTGEVEDRQGTENEYGYGCS